MAPKNITLVDKESNESVANDAEFKALIDDYQVRFLTTADSHKTNIRGFESLLDGGKYTLGESRHQQQQQQQQEQQNYPFKTPAPSRPNVQHSHSPGAQLDQADAFCPEKLLSAAQKFCEAMVSKMEVPEVDSLRKVPHLHQFTRSDVNLPHTRGSIDMRIGFAPEWPTTPVGEQLCGLMEQEYPSNVILVGKSGCGKTSAIFDAAQKRFCIYIVASSKTDDDYLASRGDPGGFDESFSDLVSDVIEKTSRGNISDDDVKLSESRHCILAFILARMLLLWTFQRQCTVAGTNCAQLSWLMYQLTEDMHRRAGFLYKSLLNRKTSLLENLQRALRTTDADLDFFFAFDEAQHGYDLLKGKKLWESRTNPGEFRGIACPLLRELSGIKPLVIAGTALSLVSIESHKSDIGKAENNTTVIDDFPSVSSEEIATKLRAVLDMNGMKYMQPKLSLLRGRGRLLGGFVSQLAKSIKDCPNLEKQAVFEDAIVTHYSICKNQLKSRIQKAFALNEQKQDKLLDNNGRKRGLPEGFGIVAVASLIRTPVSISHKKIKPDLLHVGLCSIRMVAGRDDTEFVLDEELGREAVLEVAQDHQFVTETFDLATNLCRNSTGHGMEPLIIAELHHWSVRNPNGKVQAFLSEACDGKLPGDLPEWITKAPFSVKGGYSKKGYEAEGIRDDVQFIEKAVQETAGLRDFLLSPSTVKRLDFEAVMGGGENPWFLSVSSKLYACPLDDKKNDDLRSTKPSLFYTKRDGSKNTHCCNMRNSWETTLKKQKGLFSKCLRIHVCLPDVKRPDNDERRIFVDDGSVVLYITSQNVGNIFRPRCLDVLRNLGCLQAKKN